MLEAHIKTYRHGAMRAVSFAQSARAAIDQPGDGAAAELFLRDAAGMQIARKRRVFRRH